MPPAPMPSIGDDILIFAHGRPSGYDAAVFDIRPDKQMVFEGSDGAYVPQALRGSLAAIVRSIQEIASH